MCPIFYTVIWEAVRWVCIYLPKSIEFYPLKECYIIYVLDLNKGKF